MSTIRQKRDTQRERMYAAEAEVFARYQIYEQLRNLTACKIFIGRVLRSRRARTAVEKTGVEFYWPTAITVESTQGARSTGNPTQLEIRIMPVQMRPSVLLHEMAHVIIRPIGTAWHGREFARVYLALIRSVLGKSYHDKLRAAFKQRGIKYSLPRTLPPERKAALSARFKSMHDKRRAIVEYSHSPELATALALANSDTSYS